MSRMRRVWVAAGFAVLASACSDVAPSGIDLTEAIPVESQDRGIIKGEYIVTLRDGTLNARSDALSLASSVANSLAGGSTGGSAGALGGGRSELMYVYDGVLGGFAIRMPEAAVAGLRKDPRVKSIEPNRKVTVEHHLYSQGSAPWGLDRTDQRTATANGYYSWDASGVGVRIYVIDTGVRTTHSDFAGRILTGYSNVTDGDGVEDGNGHGTHVAGIAAGAVSGVAKGAWVVPVRVLDDYAGGSAATIIDGLNWIRLNHVKPAVVNHSLGDPYGAVPSWDTAVNDLINAGVAVVTAAGNNATISASYKNACNFSPARVANAITVSATGTTDARASFAKTGPCVDLFGPGVDIPSAGISNDSHIRLESGTSMATPHVAGAVAVQLQRSPLSSPATLRTAIINNATSGVVTNLDIAGTPNKLVYSTFVPWSTVVLGLQQTNLSGSPMLDWDEVHDATGYQIDLITTHEEYNDYEGTSNIADIGGDNVGSFTTPTAFHDVARAFTNTHICTYYQSWYASASYTYWYEFRAIYPGGILGTPHRHPALVAPVTC